jgi:hypothetical protein
MLDIAEQLKLINNTWFYTMIITIKIPVIKIACARALNTHL